MSERLWSADEPAPDVLADVLARARAAGYDPQRVTAVYVNGCGDAFGTDRIGAMRRSAHTHTADGPLRGTVCFKGGPRRMTHRLVAHEAAHALTHEGHTARWREAVTNLGHPAEAAKYVNRRRRP